MGKLTELLRWKKEIALIDGSGKALKDAKGKPLKVWIRVLGDEDQQQAYRMSRVRSAEKRAALRNPDTIDFKDDILPIREADRDICEELIRASRKSQFTSDALANVERPELPKLEDIAVDADAPSLEEQEKLDAESNRVEEEYLKAIEEYVQTRELELDAEIKEMSDEKVKEEAMYETSNALALNTFLLEVQDEKAWRSVFLDEKCKERAFDSVDDFRQLPTAVKQLILDEYGKLELSPDDIKN